MNATMKGLGLALLVPLALASCASPSTTGATAGLLGTETAQAGAFGSAAQHHAAPESGPKARALPAQRAEAERAARQAARTKTLQFIPICVPTDEPDN